MKALQLAAPARGWGLSLRVRYGLLGVLLLTPTLLIFCALVVYPLLSSIWFSFFSIYTPTQQGHWVGLDNYRTLLTTAVFWSHLATTLIWTMGSLAVQMTAGVAAALLLNENILFRSLARGLILFPYFVSTVVAVLIWRWLLNDLFGIVNYALLAAGIIQDPLDFIGQMPQAMVSVILLGGWKNFPFVVMIVLARLQSIPEPLYESATMDGAGAWARFCDITLPQLREVLLVVMLFRAIWDFKDFDLIYLLTGGGPVTSTETLPLLVYKEAIRLNALGMASAIAVGMMMVMLSFVSLYLYQTRGSRS
jgi:multiple sugar transport system permease protein